MSVAYLELVLQLMRIVQRVGGSRHATDRCTSMKDNWVWKTVGQMNRQYIVGLETSLQQAVRCSVDAHFQLSIGQLRERELNKHLVKIRSYCLVGHRIDKSNFIGPLGEVSLDKILHDRRHI